MTEDRGLCWNAKMAVTVFADHPNNVLTIRADWGYFILPPDWPKFHPAVFWLASSSPWGHTWTRGIGHVTWCCHWQQPGMQHCTETTSSQASHDDILQTLTTLQTSSPLVSSWHQGLKSIIHHSSAGSGFIGRSLAHWHQFLPAPIIRSIKMFKARSKARDRVWLKWSVLRQLTQKPHLTSSSPSLFGHDTFFHLYQTKISK